MIESPAANKATGAGWLPATACSSACMDACFFDELLRARRSRLGSKPRVLCPLSRRLSLLKLSMRVRSHLLPLSCLRLLSSSSRSASAWRARNSSIHDVDSSIDGPGSTHSLPLLDCLAASSLARRRESNTALGLPVGTYAAFGIDS